jgi:ATP/maltotriose-dependent transcriptional regulator MalT
MKQFPWRLVLGYGALAAVVLACLHLISLAQLRLDWGRELLGAAIALVAVVVGLRLAQRTAPSTQREAASNEPSATSSEPVATAPDVNQSVLLSARESEVLTLLCQGCSNKEMARTLHVSENTIKTHLANLYAKLQVNRRTEAQAAAWRLGLVSSNSAIPR